MNYLSIVEKNWLEPYYTYYILLFYLFLPRVNDVIFEVRGMTRGKAVL